MLPSQNNFLSSKAEKLLLKNQKWDLAICEMTTHKVTVCNFQIFRHSRSQLTALRTKPHTFLYKIIYIQTSHFPGRRLFKEKGISLREKGNQFLYFSFRKQLEGWVFFF